MIKFGMREDLITSLSGGNQQKVLIGRGFAMRPDVIVLNDPARGIDVGAKTELYKHLRTFAGDGKCIVYMSSELEEFMGFATRVIVFRDGKPFDAFDGRSLDPKKVLEAMFGQTDGSGLKSAYGLKPSLTPDGKAAGGHGHAPLSRGVAKDDGPQTIVLPGSVKIRETVSARQTAPRNVEPVRASKPIRIVEFERANGEAREIGPGGAGR